MTLKTRVSVVVLLMAAMVTGCRSWQSHPGDIREVVLARAAAGERIRLELADGRRLLFRSPVVRSDTVFEGAAIGYLAPLTQVVKVETRQVSATRTLAFVVLVPATVMGLSLAAWALEE